jgi:hypothetical protein
LLNQVALSVGPYTATSAQSASLGVLEQRAIANTMADHGLPSADAAAAATWGRPEAESELWGLLVQAVQTPASSRTADQQNAVSWLTAVAQRQNVASADDAGLEYAKWAGLGIAAYQQELAANPGTAALQSFLSATPNPYTDGGSAGNPSASADGGYCVYQSPSPYQSEYTGNVYTPFAQSTADQTCFTPCTSLLGCTLSTPSYDQFVTWGTADAENSLNSPGSAAVGNSVAEALALGGATTASALSGVTLSSSLSGVLQGTDLAAALSPFGGVEGGTVGALGSDSLAEASAGIAATEVGGVVAIVIAAIAIAVIEGINVFSAAALPGQLAQLITGAASTTPDLGAMLASPVQATGLFTLFIGATVPDPSLTTCDNSMLLFPIDSSANPTPCLNAPAIPGPSSSDLTFAVAQKGSATSTQTSTLTWADAAQSATYSAYAFGNWFAVTETAKSDGSSVSSQALHIRYTDWNGREQDAWLMGNSTQGYSFVIVQDNPATPIDPATCHSDGTCASSQAIDYVGTDGNDYSATLPAATGIPQVPPPGTGFGSSTSTTVTASPSTVVAGHQVTFTATIDNGSLDAPGTVSFVSDLAAHDTTLCANAPVTSTAVDTPGPGGSILLSTLNTATCTYTFTATQSPVIYATYYPSADASTFASQGSLSVNVVNQASTTTTVTASSASPVVGQPVTFTATVADAGPAPTGPVTFSDGSGTLCSNVSLSSSAPYTATCTTTYNSAGPRTVTASYAGDAGTIASSGSVPVTVNRAPTTTTLTSTASGLLSVGQKVTDTATVSPAPNGGTVAFTDNGTTITGCSAVPLSGATATCTTSPGRSGAHNIAAVFGGTAAYVGSSSAALTQVVTSTPCAALANCNLSGLNLSGAQLSAVNLTGANLNGASLAGADLAMANLSGANFNKANLTGANLTGATVTGANFNKVTWSHTTCPDGTSSDADGGTCSGHL